MSSRRILSNSKLAPIQRNAVNPFDSFNSDNVNLLTRTVSGGDDVIVKGLDVESADQTLIYKSENLVKPYSTEVIFNSNWNGENYLYHGAVSEDPGKVAAIPPSIDLFLPSGKTYGLSYIQCKLSFDDFAYLFGKRGNSVRDFDISFDLMYGAPKTIIVYINNSTCVIDHPVCNNEFTTYSFKISRNLVNDTVDNGITFKIAALFDTADQWNIPITNKSVTNETFDFKTIIKISNIKCSLSEVNAKETKRTTCNGTEIYAPGDIHYVHSLKITPGIAIKDDVMLNIMGKSYADKDTAIYLDLTDDYSWIKGRKYISGDFTKGPNSQYAYQLNGKYSNENDAKRQCVYDFDKEKIKVQLDETHQVDLMDDYDYNKSIDKVINLDPYDYVANEYIFKSTVQQDIGTYSGTNLILVYTKSDNTEVAVGRTTVTIKNNKVQSFSISLHQDSLPVEFINDVNNHVIDSKLKCYLSSGPIKIVGDPTKYNTDRVKWAYVVLYYAYFKNPKPNISYIGLATEEEVLDPKYREDYLILAKVRFVDPTTIDIISYDERQMQTLPSSNNINYSKNCKHPEIWANVPNSVTDAIDALRKQMFDLEAKLDGSGIVYFYKDPEF